MGNQSLAYELGAVCTCREPAAGDCERDLERETAERESPTPKPRLLPVLFLLTLSAPLRRKTVILVAWASWQKLATFAADAGWRPQEKA